MWQLSGFDRGGHRLVFEVPLIGADVPALLKIVGASTEVDLRFVTPITRRSTLEGLQAFADFPVDTKRYSYYLEEVQVEGPMP